MVILDKLQISLKWKSSIKNSFLQVVNQLLSRLIPYNKRALDSEDLEKRIQVATGDNSATEPKRKESKPTPQFISKSYATPWRRNLLSCTLDRLLASSLPMANLKSDSPTSRRIVRAFLDFLSSGSSLSLLYI